MADKEISSLPELTSLRSDALFVVRQDGTAQKVTAAQLAEVFGSSGGGGSGSGGGGAAGAFQFDIDDGELVMIYAGDVPPSAEINENGELILKVDDSHVINVGHVQGRNGKNGQTPNIGDDGNWYIGGNDTGIPATGTIIEGVNATVDGLSSDTPTVTVTEDGTAERKSYEFAFSGLKGKDGTVAFDALTEAQKTSLKGDKGDPGQKGDPGAKGDPGEPGEKGDPGAKGDPGEPGKQGDPGTPGADGKSAYQTAKEAGFTGTEAAFASALSALCAPPVDLGDEIENLLPDEITLVLYEFFQSGYVCTFVIQFKYSPPEDAHEYGFDLFRLPRRSPGRVWLNNSNQFYIQGGNSLTIRYNGDSLKAGNYTISATYITNEL